MQDKIVQLAIEQAPVLLFCLGAMWATYWATGRIYDKLVQAKQDEIERLVVDRNKLQDLIIEDRLSTSPKDEKKKK